jgi:hypothetical protein
MRCDDVIRELSGPGPVPDDDGTLSGHLTRCGRCATWAARQARLQRLWDATAPEDVPGEAWDRVWSAIRSGLDREDGRMGGKLSSRGASPAGVGQRIRVAGPARPWRSLGIIGLVGLAQAAAVLLAVRLSWTDPAVPSTRPASVPQPAVAGRTEPSLDSVFDVEDGQVALIRSEGKQVRMVDLADLDTGNGDDPWFVFFNRVEAASTVVAMSE